MLPRLVLALVLTTGAVSARAADMPSIEDTILRGGYVPELTPTPPTLDWSGIVIGAQVGLSTMHTDFGNATSSEIAYALRNTTVQNEFEPSTWTTLPADTTNSTFYGGFIGYNYQLDKLVLGADIAYNRPKELHSEASDFISRIVTTSDDISHTVSITSAASLDLVDYATFRVRAGYAFDQFLPYAVVGGAVGRFNYTTTATVVDDWTPVGGGATTHFAPPTQSSSKDGAITAGFVAGLGVDVSLLPNMFFRAEYEYVVFAPLNGIRAQLNTGRVGIGFRF